jgi:hypothetical protein
MSDDSPMNDNKSLIENVLKENILLKELMKAKCEEDN